MPRRDYADEEEPSDHSNPDNTNFEDDYENNNGPGSPPPARSVSFRKKNKESPGIKTVGTDDTATLTINHTNRAGPALCMGMTRPALCLVAILLLLFLGGGLFGWLSIPGLQNQIKELEQQVDRLEGQVDRLKVENDRFEKLNNELNASIAELNIINENLNATVFRLEGEVDRLEVLNDELAFENDRYSKLNDVLNDTVDELGEEVDELEEQVDALELSNEQLRILTTNLQNETARLGQEVDDLEATVSDLETETDKLSDEVDNLNTTVANLARENDRLRELNANLESIVGFLNETSSEISDTLDGVVDFLAEQIVANRRILMQNQQDNYEDKQHAWRCTYQVTFVDRDFGNNFNLSIGADNIPEVLNYVEEQVLNDFCANRDDFEEFLTARYGLGDMSSHELFQGVLLYTDEILKYYFPPVDDGSGLTPEEWADAEYDCQNLPQQFESGTSI